MDGWTDEGVMKIKNLKSAQERRVAVTSHFIFCWPAPKQ